MQERKRGRSGRSAYDRGVAITGAHVLVYSPEAEVLRATLRDVFGWPHVDNGDGWLIFKLPPAEIGVHPSDGETEHQLSLMCDDIQATVAELRAKGVEIPGEPEDKGFGIGVRIVLPGGVDVLLYEPRHATALDL
jgi:catechol 2,3-dioxygenase-like lactoylglutathione lyase family enzyme